MLEKIGLPAKPSLRGNNWVLDASHCQGCSSQFTFINRKHHCRRCGGLFCNSCTQQRMVLRGQGDSPVRICEPCKELEEAARYELRYKHRNKAGKGGSSKAASRSVDEVLNELLTDKGKYSPKPQEAAFQDGTGDTMSNAGADEPTSFHDAGGPANPEDLRQQALEEKNKYKTLKGEGKSTEALKAFKKAKELERQAAAVELQLRKDRKKALASRSTALSQKNEDDSPEATRKTKLSVQRGKEKNDLTDELKLLGWSDMDLHDAEKNPAPTSLESELFNLMGDSSTKTDQSNRAYAVDKSEVVTLKRKALMLKREGKLAEAKEELRKAKVLERQLEEQEFLADADDSDDEISSLIRSMDDNRQDDFSVGFDMNSGFEPDNLVGDGGDPGIRGNFEVTDDDMYDPDLVAALQSVGWTEEHNEMEKPVSQPISVDTEALAREIVSLKKEAVSQKHSGNIDEAMSLLKKSKLLEKNLQNLDSYKVSSTHVSELGSNLDGFEGRIAKETTNMGTKPASRSRLTIQRELLSLKKKALALRKEGKVDEAEEELKKGKVLEQQLEEMDNAPKMRSHRVEATNGDSAFSYQELDISTGLPTFEEGDGDITEQDMHDPSYLTLLKSLGWEDEESEVKKVISGESCQSTAQVSQSGPVVEKKRSKAEIQRELLGLKRKALALRRQGQASEADQVLSEAKVLELQLEEREAPTQAEPTLDFAKHEGEMGPVKIDTVAETKLGPKEEAVTGLSQPKEPETVNPPFGRPLEVKDAALERDKSVGVAGLTSNLNQSTSGDIRSSIQQEILSHKKIAVVLKREGRLEEAREELRKAKLLERTLEQEEKPRESATSSGKEAPTSSVPSVVEELSPPASAPKPMSSQERFKLQRECLNHKRNAMKLRREGRTEEAEAEYQLAKTLEAQLEESSDQIPVGSLSEDVGLGNDLGVQGLLDPQLSSALKSLGLPDIHGLSSAPMRAEPSVPEPPQKRESSGALKSLGLSDTHGVSSAPVRAELAVSEPSQKRESSGQERALLEAQIKAEKVKALNLKRSGNQTEALDVLRRAKQLEKKLNSLTLE